MTRKTIRYLVRYGIGLILTLMVLYLYLILISVYQDEHGSDLRAEAVVEDIRIAYPNDPWRRWVVDFRVNRVLNGHLDAPNVSVRVHSPGMELGVRKVGQNVILQRRDSYWSTSAGPHEFRLRIKR
jgi:hypothetical protein